MSNSDLKTTTYSNGKFESQTICNEDKTDGYRVHWYESGQMKSAAEYKYGKLDGLYAEWHENGNKAAEINYLDGVKHGDITRWHKNSKVKLKAQYKYGNLDGFHATWHKNEQTKSECEYQDHGLHGKYTARHKNGQIKFTADYKDGKRILTPIFTTWHANGNKSFEVNYNKGHRHGTCTLWHKDGSKRSEVIYTNGRMDGLWAVWHSTGQIKKAILFKDCREVSKATWYSNGNIKYNAELGDEYFNRALCKFSDTNYGDWINYYSPHPNGFEFDLNGSDFSRGGRRFPILMTHWYKNGQKSYECIQYGYEDSTIYWHENGQKSMEVGKKKGDPQIYWNNCGKKEYESKFDWDSSPSGGYTYSQKFFDNNEQYVATVVQTEEYDDFIEWKFFNKNNNKVYSYKHDYLKDSYMNSDELWDIWLNSECKEFVKTLKSIDEHKLTFCKIPNYI